MLTLHSAALISESCYGRGPVACTLISILFHFCRQLHIKYSLYHALIRVSFCMILRGDGQREKNPVRERRHRPKELSWRNERQEHLPQVIIFLANWSLIDKPGRFEPSSSFLQWAKLSLNPVGIFIFPRLHRFQVVSFTALSVIVAFATWTLSG